MTQRETASVLIKVLGVMFLVQYFTVMPVAVLSFLAGSARNGGSWDTGAVLVTLGLGGMGMLIFAILISASGHVARKVVPTDGEMPFTGGLDRSQWQVLGYNLLGLYLLSEALVGLTRSLTWIVSNRRQYGWVTVEKFFQTEVLPDLLGVAVKLSIGLVLFFGARGVQDLWQRFLDSRRIPGEEI